jgi:hypothetical protein
VTCLDEQVGVDQRQRAQLGAPQRARGLARSSASALTSGASGSEAPVRTRSSARAITASTSPGASFRAARKAAAASSSRPRSACTRPRSSATCQRSELSAGEAIDRPRRHALVTGPDRQLGLQRQRVGLGRGPAGERRDLLLRAPVLADRQQHARARELGRQVLRRQTSGRLDLELRPPVLAGRHRQLGLRSSCTRA